MVRTHCLSEIISLGVVMALFAAVFFFLSAPPQAAAKKDLVHDKHAGITLIGLKPPAEIVYDVPIMGPREALERIIKALKLIQGKSPFSVSQFENLKKNGPVTIIYDPRYPDPKADISSVRVAVFLPGLSNGDGGLVEGKKFYALIGRHGIKWPLSELAAVLVHELAGHGTQHLKGLTKTVRPGDLECQASLYQEMAHQNLGMDKFSSEMISFQKQLAVICRNFIDFIRKHDPESVRLWEVSNPDIPKLLGAFESYLKSMGNESSPTKPENSR